MGNDRINENMCPDDDSRLIAAFFAENVADVPDDGFSGRVMHRLPRCKSNINRIWTWLCIIAGVVFLVLTKSWLVPYSILNGMLEDIDVVQLLHFNYVPYIVAMFVISVLLGYSLADERKFF